jgi:hypothetical protein
MLTKNQIITYDTVLKSMDVTGSGHIEVILRHDHKVLWINEGGRCLLRICNIGGKIIIQDDREGESNDIRSNDK